MWKLYINIMLTIKQINYIIKKIKLFKLDENKISIKN